MYRHILYVPRQFILGLISLFFLFEVLSGCSGSSSGSLSSDASPAVEAPKLLSITPLTKTVALSGSTSFTASGGTEPYTFDVYYGNGAVTTAGATGTYQAPNSQGTAVVRVQDANSNTGYANIEIIDAPVIQPTSKVLAVNNKFPFAVLSGKAPYTFSIASGEGTINSATGEFTASANAGAVTIRVTDADGRSAEANVTVNPALSFTTKTVYVEKNATYTLVTSGGVAPYSYVIASGAGLVDKAAGVFTAPGILGVSTVHVFDSLGNVDLAVINITTALSINPSTALIAKNGSLTFSAVGGVPPYTYAVQAGGVGTIVSATGVYSAPTSTGSATVRVTDSLGHTSDSTVSITNNLSFSVANIILAVGNTIDISTVVNGGVAPLTYSVPTSQGLIAGATYTAPSSPGVYTITVYDSQTPTANSVTTSVLVNSALVLLPASATVAVSTQKSFSAAGGVPPYTYSVQSGGGSITDGLYTAPTSSGSAVLLVTDARGNTATTNVSIQSALAIVPSTKTLSAGESFTFTATGGNSPYTFSLLSGAGAINSSSGLYAAPGSSGLATVRVEDAAGNRKDALITILSPLSIAPPTISLIKNAAITFTASGGAGPYSFSITSGEGSVNATTGVFTASAVAGTSTVRVADSLGSIKDATVTIYDGLTISPFTKSLALNQAFTFTANGGVAPYTYSLVSGVGSISNAGAYASSTAGAAIVRVTDAAGNTSDATITVNSALAINPTSKTLSVNNQFTFSATGGVPPYAFSKVSGNGTITTAGDYTAPAASTSAVVRVTDADGTTADSTITVNDALTISPTAVTVAAGGTQSFISAGGVGPHVYTVISGGGSFASAVYTAPAIASGASVSVIATDSLGNTANAVITIAPITVTISSPNSSDAITNTNKAAFAVSGTCSEASQAVSVTATDGTTTTSTATPTCTSGSWSTNINLTSLSDTTITITATHANVNNVAATPATVTLSKDGTAPTVASITSSTPNGTYGIGANISIQIVFSESVSVTGVPTLNLATGRSGAAASYTSGSNTNTLTFSYTVVSGDNSSDLDYSSTSALVVTAGTIKDTAGNVQTTPTLPAPGATNSLGANKALVINTAVPGAPTNLTLVTPSTSPSTNQTPVINVTGVTSGDTVKLFTDSSCQTTAKATGTATSTTIDLTSLSLTEGSYTFYASRTDSVGNASNCSSANLPYVVDLTTPSITNITSTNSNGVYKAGATISIQMQFSEVVTVTSVPQLSLTANNGSKYASYASGTGTNTLTFTYTVVSGDNTANLDYTSTAALSLAGGSISDAAGNLLLVPLLPTPGASGSLSANKTIVLDTTAPTKPSALALNTPASSPGTVATPIIQVSGVVSGDTVKLFSDTCTTQVSSGTASGTTILLTSTTLSAGSYAFYANSTDPVGNISECSSANPTPASVAYVLDLTAAAITNVTAVSNGTYTTGGTFTISVVFSKVVNVTGAPVLALTTGQASQATYSSGTGSDTLVFAYTVASGDNSSDLTYTATNSLTLAGGTIKDNAGNDATLTLPTIGASGSLSYNRNIVLDTTAPTAPTITGDGIWMTTTATSPNITFTAGTDSGGSGILKHQIQVVLGSNTTTVLNAWADFNTSNTAITGLTLSDATLYKVQMKAIDNAGNESSVVTSTDGWTVDTTVPSTPGSVNDGATSSASSSPALSWSASTDAGGIDYYEVAIGTSAGGTQIQTWTSVTNVTSATITGLTLSAGTTYYASVRAKDLAGNTSLVGQGDGWMVQASPSGTCPTGYILVPALTGYTTTDFCVAKYEMKNVGGIATSGTASTPWVSIARGTDATTAGGAWKACKDLGAQYDLISNAQWQTIARNIADTAVNWSTGTVYSGELNRGHSDAVPYNTLAASNDNDVCNGTGQTCSSTTWSSQRRTHVLSNGNIIWDLAGNAWEFVNDNNSSVQGADGYDSTFKGGDSRQINYGNDTFCASPSTTPYCGMGYGYTNYSGGTVARGGFFDNDAQTGIFTAGLSFDAVTAHTYYGFRCVYAPNPSVPGFVDDGTISSLTSSSTISWTASTVTSGSITNYEIAIGTTAGGTQAKDWTSVGNVTSATLVGLSLTAGSTYYASVRAIDNSGNISPAGLGDGFMATTSGTCPTGYISVPPLAGYTTTPFCVAKYEMKNNSGAKSEAAGTPWVSIARGTDATTAGGAWKACKDLGAQYDLISNAQWQTIARNIADQGVNWSGGTAYSGELNSGHSDSSPNNLLEASTDNDPYSGTTNTNSDAWNGGTLTAGDEQKRTHTLSNGNIIWDFAGNAWEWVKDNSTALATSGYVSTYSSGDSEHALYGNDSFCASTSTTPYCRMGYWYTTSSAGGTIRGSAKDSSATSGIFAAASNYSPTSTAYTSVTFRCVYTPN